MLGKLVAQEAATESEHYQYEISELKRHVIEITQKRVEEEDQMIAVNRQLKGIALSSHPLNPFSQLTLSILPINPP